MVNIKEVGRLLAEVGSLMMIPYKRKKNSKNSA